LKSIDIGCSTTGVGGLRFFSTGDVTPLSKNDDDEARPIRRGRHLSPQQKGDPPVEKKRPVHAWWITGLLMSGLSPGC
jgi:hypothetical protein